MPIDSSRRSRKGKGKCKGQHIKKARVAESSSEEEEYCEICGSHEHFPVVCSYLIHMPPGRHLVNKEKYHVVCFCGRPVGDNGEFTCYKCLPGAPKSVSLRPEFAPPPKQFWPIPGEPGEHREPRNLSHPALERVLEHFNKIMRARCQVKGEENYNGFESCQVKGEENYNGFESEYD